MFNANDFEPGTNILKNPGYSLTIKLNPDYAIGRDETLVISYDGNFNIEDKAGNPLATFQQAINNSSTVTGRDITPPEVNNANTDTLDNPSPLTSPNN